MCSTKDLLPEQIKNWCYCVQLLLKVSAMPAIATCYRSVVCPSVSLSHSCTVRKLVNRVIEMPLDSDIHCVELTVTGAPVLHGNGRSVRWSGLVSVAHWHSARWAWNGYQPGLGSIPRPGWINCFRITGVHALRLISRTGKRVWRCPL